MRFRRAHSYLRPWHYLRRMERWSQPGDRIAVVVAEGNIVDSDSDQAFPGQVAYRPVASVLRELAIDDSVKAVVLRINSPGGSGAASDLIWREIIRLRKKKPVIASMSGTAASGGYYLAMASDRILAGELTITGSIGVVAGKFDLSGLLGKLGIRQEVISYGQNTGIYSATSGLTESERGRLREHLELFYDTFTRKAAEGRRMEQTDLEQHARGRIWTGAQAAQRDLVDATGGLADALEFAAREAKVGSDWEPWIVEPPHPGFMERMQRMVPFGLGTQALLEEPVRKLLGPSTDLVQARLPAKNEIK